ncbi:hypothetical protein O7632_27070 [Solwaraspora sp. WMMD406]|uniref:hypothetical protein n=1 Tax=Solwaraspora sp. WMMD406 TaxID=3016095 RepID=UPI0024167D36|nr:hypothetical protein [Solwaraspora sp. WMMD406]MDG4767728.1 hypothetical protein [Solwaraspora sp. WMMD406]
MTDMPRSAEGAAKLLAEVVELVRSLSVDDVERLLKGEAKLAVVSRSVKPSSNRNFASSIDIDGIRSTLVAMDSRDDGLLYLRQLKLSRNALQALSEAMDLPVRKSDKIEDLMGNLIEATIGFRLRSNAIREPG